jgi:hypothetical protein
VSLCVFVRRFCSNTHSIIQWSRKAGSPNMSCLSYFVSWLHSCCRHLGPFVCTDELWRVQFWNKSLHDGLSIASADTGGHAWSSSASHSNVLLLIPQSLLLLFFYCMKMMCDDIELVKVQLGNPLTSWQCLGVGQ